MNTNALLKKLVSERRSAINQTKYISVRWCSPFVRRAYQDYQRGRKLQDRAQRELQDAGYEPDRPGQLRETGRTAATQRVQLALREQTATIGLLKATTGPERARVIEKFIADTREFLP